MKLLNVNKKSNKGDLSVVVSATGTLNPTNGVDIGIFIWNNKRDFM